MYLGIVAARDSVSKNNAKILEKYIRKNYPDQGLCFNLEKKVPDILITIGDDRFILDTLRDVDPKIDFLGVGNGFLSEVPFEHYEGWIGKCIKNDYWVEERMRLALDANEKKLPPILNEAALIASKGGGFLNYSLKIDDELIWRDAGDGVIICTPTGSTGYGLSAGGPIVMENAETIVIIPICSAKGQHPLVIPKQSKISITGIDARLAKEVVLDGKVRIRLDSSGFTIKQSKYPARFIHFGTARYLKMFGKIRSKRSEKAQLSGAPPSAKFIYRLLEDEGPLTEKQLISESDLPERTVRNAITELLKRKLVQKVQSLRDTREFFYCVI